jgi:hypothetical protein
MPTSTVEELRATVAHYALTFGWRDAQAAARAVQARHPGMIVRPSVTPWGTGPEDLPEPRALAELPNVTFLLVFPDDSMATCKASIRESAERMAARIEALIAL